MEFKDWLKKEDANIDTYNYPEESMQAAWDAGMLQKGMIVLKHTETNYLLNLALQNFEKGTYWGRKDYFEAMQNKVIEKLKVATNAKATK